MMRQSFNRRRFLAISASTLAVGGPAHAVTESWRGVALGSLASIRIGGVGRAETQETFAAVEAELSRLEDVFSLYRADSAIATLNRTGRLEMPPVDLVAVLDLSDRLHIATGGAFDPTVQPLWQHFAGSSANRESVEEVRGLVGWSGLRRDGDAIVFARPGMAITLNGIAQGYITDRIAALFRSRGFADVLIDAGEVAVLGRNQRMSWDAAVADSQGNIVQWLTLRDRCLATSSPLAMTLAVDGQVGHILDPRPGRSGPTRRLVAISAPSAAVADGLATACCLLRTAEAEAAVAVFDGARIETLI